MLCDGGHKEHASEEDLYIVNLVTMAMIIELTWS
jgi:hypothetical protein